MTNTTKHALGMTTDLSGLMKALDKMMPAEVIDGSSVREVAANFIDLEMGFSPVIPAAFPDPAENDLSFVPEPRRVTMESDRYAIVYPEENDFEWVGVGELKVMRARYILLRGFYNENFDRHSYYQQQTILAFFFPDGRLDIKRLMKGEA